ncbi:MAG TPA: alkaline phosphatase D family protein [Burkholderiales bacterium]|nr:alkaline phosphatase D family protein [Burkholderiales bacterium]
MKINRRRFLAAAGSVLLPHPVVFAQPSLQRDPFTLGVASGYPHPEGATLWTRLAPEPLHGGGMPQTPVEVEWEIATDEKLRNSVRRGRALALPEWGHSIHVDVTGLEPARWYWYRFRALGFASPIGRLRTAASPASDAPFRFAFASCQQYEQGYFVAYRHMAQEDLDLVIHVGDYIYESSWGRNHVRSHGADEPRTLIEYRNRYALYKSDADLQAAHATFPWILTWDDHEVQNDYANDRSQFLDDPAVFLERRAAAYQAYYEHQPLPAWARPAGPRMQLYTRAAFGQLAQFHVLDDRQYRSHQVCPRPDRGGSNIVFASACPERLDEKLTLLGRAQEEWLLSGLAQSKARWNIIAQQTLMAQADRYPGSEAQQFWTDGWDGYPRARERLLRFIAERRMGNVIVIGGDVHMSVVADLKVDFDDPRAPVVASEFVTTSITAQGLARKAVETIASKNPHIKFINSMNRGYTTVELNAERCIARLRAVRSVTDRYATIRDLAAYAVEHGKPGPQRY